MAIRFKKWVGKPGDHEPKIHDLGTPTSKPVKKSELKVAHTGFDLSDEIKDYALDIIKNHPGLLPKITDIQPVPSKKGTSVVATVTNQQTATKTAQKNLEKAMLHGAMYGGGFKKFDGYLAKKELDYSFEAPASFTKKLTGAELPSDKNKTSVFLDVEPDYAKQSFHVKFSASIPKISVNSGVTSFDIGQSNHHGDLDTLAEYHIESIIDQAVGMVKKGLMQKKEGLVNTLLQSIKSKY